VLVSYSTRQGAQCPGVASGSLDPLAPSRAKRAKAEAAPRPAAAAGTSRCAGRCRRPKGGSIAPPAPRQAFAFPAVGQRRGSRGSWEGGRDRWLAPARDPPASAQGLRAGWPAGRARRRDAVCLAASGARVANPDRVAGRFCFSLFLLSAWLSCVRACRERRWPEPKADQQPVAHAPLHRWPGRLTTTSGKGLKGQWKERTLHLHAWGVLGKRGWLWRMLSVPVARWMR